MLTAVLSLVSPGSSEQAVAAIMLSTIYIKMYNVCKPYVSDSNDELAEIGQYQVYFTFFGALIMQNELLNSKWDAAVGALLITINFSVVVATAVTEIRNVKQTDDVDVSEAEIAYRKSLMAYKDFPKTDSVILEPKKPTRRRSSISTRDAINQYEKAYSNYKKSIEGAPSEGPNPANKQGAIELSQISSRSKRINRAMSQDRDDSDDETSPATTDAQEGIDSTWNTDTSVGIVKSSPLRKSLNNLQPDSDDDSEDDSNIHGDTFTL